ncbi:hypothetical protein [Carnobacterium divergens]|uniref:hypothetical protein n=1 Tax=Carnobacterium divergens TaxID=2748 RepID=UPI0039AFDD0F
MTNFKKRLIKGVVASSFILGVGFSSTSGLLSNNEVQAAPKNVHTITKPNGVQRIDPGYTQVVHIGNGLSLSVTMTDEENFTWELFSDEEPETVLATGVAQLNVEFTITYQDPVTGEEETIVETLVENKPEKPAEPVQNITDFSFMYNGKAVSENNFATSYVGEAFDPLKGITFVDASGKAFDGTITADVSQVDTSKIGVYPVKYTITENVAADEQRASAEPQVMEFQSAVAIMNASMVEKIVEETTLTINKTTNTEANKATHTSKNGLLKFEVWYISETNYGLRVTNLDSGEVVKDDIISSTIYNSLIFTVEMPLLNAKDVYVIKFNFTEGGTGTEVLNETVSANAASGNQTPAKSAASTKPTKLAQTNAGFGFMPTFSSIGLLGGSLAAFVRSRKK